MLLSAAIIGASERYSLLDIVLHSFAFSFIDRLKGNKIEKQCRIVIILVRF